MLLFFSTYYHSHNVLKGNAKLQKKAISCGKVVKKHTFPQPIFKFVYDNPFNGFCG